MKRCREEIFSINTYLYIKWDFKMKKLSSWLKITNLLLLLDFGGREN